MPKSQITYNKSQIANSNILFMVTQGHVASELHYIFVFAKTMATNLDGMMACEIEISTKF